MYKVFLLCFAFSSISAHAQNEGRVIMPKINKSVVKFSAFHPLVGEVPFSFEQQLGKNFSVELDIGLTISEINFNNWAQNSHESEYFYYDFNHKSTETVTEAELGFSVALGIRYYVLRKSMGLRGLYISPQAKFKRYTYSMTGIDASELPIIEPYTANDDRLRFSFNLGYQFWLNRLSIDVYGGIGITKRSNYQPRSFQHWYNGEWNYYWEERELKFLSSAGFLGVKFGINPKG